MLMTYVEDTVSDSSRGDSSVVWMKYTRAEQRCDENLLQAAM